MTHLLQNNKKQLSAKTIAIVLFCAIVFGLSHNIGFFWDNVLLCSKMGHWLYNNGLFNFYIPDDYDPGHPPLMAFINAFGWKVFAKKLWVSHLIMMPFLFGMVWQLEILVGRFITNNKLKIFAIAFCFCDATLLSQCFLVAPEVLHIFFFLLAVNSIYMQKHFLKTIALFFLCLVSLRGMMLGFGVLLFELYYSKKVIQSSISTLKNLLAYCIGYSGAAAYIVWRIFAKGYLQTKAGSQWEDLWHIANFKTVIYNCIILLHRYLDFGRVIVFCMLLFFVAKYFTKDVSKKAQQLIALSVLSVSAIVLVSLFATNTMGHRYFTISFLFLHILFVYMAISFVKNKAVVVVAAVALTSGNLWFYPKKIAMGWDASLRFMPYFSLREQAINYLQQQKIPIQNVGSFFPNKCSSEFINLNNDTASFNEFNGSNIYVLSSCIYNLSDSNLALINNNYSVMKEFNKFGIDVTLLKKK